MSATRTRNLLVAVGVLAAVLDLLTKWWVFEAIPRGSHRVVLGDLVWFQPTYNPFGPWSLGRDVQLPAWVLPILSVAAVVLIGRIFWESDFRDRVKGLGFVLILGGAVGNLWDRFARLLDPDFGGVRDFVLVRGVWFYKVRVAPDDWDWRWGGDFPSFNLADACITVGVVLVAWRILFEGVPGDSSGSLREPDPGAAREGAAAADGARA